MARRIAATLERLGGRIEYRTPVERVAVVGSRATGVVVDGEARAFDAVIVTPDLRMAVDELVAPPIAAGLAGHPRATAPPIPAPLAINTYAAYEGYAPAGCTAMTLFMNGDTYDWWAARKADGTYAEEKRKLAEAATAAVSRKYPLIEGKVEGWDVATPPTYAR